MRWDPTGISLFIFTTIIVFSEEDEYEDEEEIKEGPKIVWVSSIRLNHSTNQFIFDPNFFDLVGIEEIHQRNTIVSKQNAVLDKIADRLNNSWKPKTLDYTLRRIDGQPNKFLLED